MERSAHGDRNRRLYELDLILAGTEANYDDANWNVGNGARENHSKGFRYHGSCNESSIRPYETEKEAMDGFCDRHLQTTFSQPAPDRGSRLAALRPGIHTQ